MRAIKYRYAHIHAVISTAAPRADPRRMRMDQILLGMSGMGLATDSPQRDDSSSGGGAAAKRQRFRLVTTLELKALEASR